MNDQIECVEVIGLLACSLFKANANTGLQLKRFCRGLLRQKRATNRQIVFAVAGFDQSQSVVGATAYVRRQSECEHAVRREPGSIGQLELQQRQEGGRWYLWVGWGRLIHVES